MAGEGALENLTALSFVLVAACIWRMRRVGDPPRTLAALSIVFLFFCAHELDWLTLWTGTSMLRASYYLGPAPAQHKAVVNTIEERLELELTLIALRQSRRREGALIALHTEQGVTGSTYLFCYTPTCC